MTVLVDSSVWIAYLRDSGGPEVDLLERLIDEQRAATTDVVLLEVLAGTTDEERAARLRRFLADREPLVYRRYARWWDTLPKAELRTL